MEKVETHEAELAEAQARFKRAVLDRNRARRPIDFEDATQRMKVAKHDIARHAARLSTYAWHFGLPVWHAGCMDSGCRHLARTAGALGQEVLPERLEAHRGTFTKGKVE
jgi:hypothetical protein